MNYPFNVRSFFTDRESRNIGGGLEVWRGYFQSVRPGIGRMLINIDISTGMMYRSGSLISLCLEVIERSDPNMLSPRQGFPERKRLQLQRFITGMRVMTKVAGSADNRPGIPRVIKKLSVAGANALTFTLREGGNLTVAEYYRRQNVVLQFPDLLCIEVANLFIFFSVPLKAYLQVGSGALIPLEMCTVPPGQIVRKQIPPEKTKDVLDFATKKPAERLASIQNGLQVILTLTYSCLCLMLS